MYKLIDTNTNEILKSRVDLSEKEKNILNYAYALNQKPLKYIKDSSKKSLTNELELFKFNQPI